MKSFIFKYDESNPNFHPSYEYNHVFLHAQANYFNDWLKTIGFLTLNDLLDALGVNRTVDGMVYGWLAVDGGVNFGFDQMEDGTITLAFLADNIHEKLGGN